MLWPLVFALTAGVCVPVTGPHILVKDLAVAIPAFAEAPSEESIGFAPSPGSQRRFTVGEVSRLAEHFVVTAETRAVCFERDLELLTEPRLMEALREVLPADTSMEIIAFSKMKVPIGRLEFPREGLSRAPAASPHEPLVWRGHVTYAPAQSVPVWVKTRLWVSHPGVEAIRDLPPGRPIDEADLRLSMIDASPFGEAAVVSIGEVRGFVPRRMIHAGQPIRASWVETPPDVARGEMVGIEARYGAALLKYEVRAEAPGRIGNSIEVRNVESGKSFRARVIRKGWVAVE